MTITITADDGTTLDILTLAPGARPDYDSARDDSRDEQTYEDDTDDVLDALNIMLRDLRRERHAARLTPVRPAFLPLPSPPTRNK